MIESPACRAFLDYMGPVTHHWYMGAWIAWPMWSHLNSYDMVFCKLCQDRFNSIHSPSQANCIFQLEVQLDIGKLEERWRDVFIIRSDLILPKLKEESPWESMDWEVDCEISGFDGHDIDWSIRWLVSWKTILVMSHVVHLLNVLMVLCSYVVMRLSSLLDGVMVLCSYGLM